MASNSDGPFAAIPLPDFFHLAPSIHLDASFECSSSMRDGDGSLAVTADAVYVGEVGGVVRIEARNIDSWIATSADPIFALTVEDGVAHVTHLASAFRSAAVSAMTRAYGPEGAQLRPAS
ncbi:hypothetical protein HQQ80_07785 [Microbacteriaceae bacterium VKM Ac-2855]|nr:hypothetical protein [Microbacteriaceae bacterium VKM Ac-2855]